MVGEGDDARANTQDETRVDLAVRVGVAVRLQRCQVVHKHGNHASFFLLRVNVLHQSVLNHLGPPISFVVDELRHVLTLYLQSLAPRVDDVQRSAGASGIGENPHFVVHQIPNNCDLSVDLPLAPEIA